MKMMLMSHILATTLKVNYEKPYECNVTNKSNFHKNIELHVESTFTYMS
jgi:hypothetical protein